MLLIKRFLILVLAICFLTFLVFSASGSNVDLTKPVVFPCLNKSILGNTNFFNRASKDKNLILLKNAIFDPLRDGEVDLSSLVPNRLKYSPSQKKHYIVQFKNNVRFYDKVSLKALGVKILEYIPNNAFLVEASDSALNKVKNLENVRWIGDFQPGYKIAPDLTNYLISKVNPFETKVPEMAVILFDDGDIAEVLDKVTESFSGDSSFGFNVTSGKSFILDISYDNVRNLIDFLSNMTEVSYIEAYHRVYTKNDNSIWVCQSGDKTTKATPIFDHGIMGQGQIVAVTDSGLDEDECAFINEPAGDRITTQSVTPPDPITVDTTQRKVVAYNVLEGAEEWDDSTHEWHGTHVCGSVGGDNYAHLASATDPGHDTGDGMAPLAKIIMEDAGTPDSGYLQIPYPYGDLWQQEYDAGARIASNSWGGSNGSYYDAGCASIDLFTYENEDFLICFASGNDGPLGNSLDYEGNAKNALIVGATKNGSTGAMDLASFSSKGPAADGRYKPDVCAPGEYIVSAKGSNSMYNCGTWTMSGTSMATPTAAGLAALVRTYFEKGFYPSGTENDQDGFEPSAALVKATLINSCVNMTGINTGGVMNSEEDAPSNGQGWGRIQLDNALYFNGDSRKLLCWDYRNKDGLTTGMERDYTFSISSKDSEPLKITLVWSDPPGATHSALQLVNDLDLELVAPDGTVYRGNQWNDQTSGDLKESAQNPTGTDTLNNVEGILIRNPQSGTYTLKVKGANVPGYKNDYKQGYALVVTGNVSRGNTLQLNVVNIDVDDSAGNNDGNIDPGETIYLKISLSNNSSVDASSVSATLTSDNSKVSVTSNNVYYGDISAGSTVTPSSAFSFNLDSSAEQGSDLHFTLTITAGSQTFTKDFSLRVHMPSVAPILSNLQIAEGNVYSYNGIQYPTYVTMDVGYHYNDPNLDIKNLYLFFKVNGEDIGTIPFVIPISEINAQTSAEGDDAWEIYDFSYFATNVGETVSVYGYLEDSLGNVSDIVQSNSFTFTKGVTPSTLAGLDDDDSIYIAFPDGFTFPFYGKTYSGMWVNSDGNITFGAGYEWQDRSPSAFLNFEPRVAPLYTDLAKAKGNANEITMETGNDYVKVNWVNLPQWAQAGPSGSNTFSATLKKDGTVIFDYGDCSMTESQQDENGDKWKGVVGLSPGGLTSGSEVDLSSYSGDIDIPVSGPIFEAFSDTDDFDLSNKELTFKPITNFVPSQVIYFPVMEYQSGSKNVGYGFVNTSSSTAFIKFTAYDEDGSEIAQSSIMQLNSGCQMAYETQAIFPNISDGSVGWVKAESSVNGLKGFFLSEDISSGALVGLDGANGFGEGYSDLIIPEVKITSQNTTTLYIVNLSGSDQDVTIKGYDENGEVDGTTVTISAGGSYVGDLSQIFSTQIWAVRVTGTGNLIANALIKHGSGSTSSISSVNGVPISSASKNIYAPHAVYWVDQYYTTLYLVNTSSTNATVDITFHGEDGTTGSPLSYTVSANSVRVLTNADLGLDTSSDKSVGWLEISSDQPLIGALEFGNPDDDHYRASLPLQTTPMSDLYFSQVANGTVGSVNYWTGLALVNPNDSAATVNIEVYGSDGTKLGETGNITVDSKVKLINLLRGFQNLENLPDQSSGYIHVVSDKPVFAFEIFGDSALNFISSVSAQ